MVTNEARDIQLPRFAVQKTNLRSDIYKVLEKHCYMKGRVREETGTELTERQESHGTETCYIKSRKVHRVRRDKCQVDTGRL